MNSKIQQIPGIYRLGIIHFLIRTQFWFPIWVLFLLDRGITLGEVIIADVVFNFGVIVFEFPFGILGDRIGRRLTYFLGIMMGAVTFLVMMLVYNFVVLLLCWLLWAVSLALISGTDSAYLYEIIKETGEEAQALQIFGIFGAISSTALVTSHLVAGLLYTLDSNLPIFVNAIFSIAAAIVVLSAPNSMKRQPNTLTIWEDIRAPLQLSKANRMIRNIIILMPVLIMYHWTLTLLFQPLLTEQGVQIEYFGLFFAGFTGLGILGGAMTGYLSEKAGENTVILVAVAGLILAVGTVGFGPAGLGLIGIVFLRFMFFLINPILQVKLNREIKNHQRAALLSFANLLASLMLMFSRPFVGVIANEWGVQVSFQWWFLIGFGVFLLSLVLVPPLQSHGKSIES